MSTCHNMSQHWVSLSHHMSHFRVLGSALRASPCNLAARLMAPGTAGPQGAPRTAAGSGQNGRPSWFEPHRAVTAVTSVTGVIMSRLSRSESENDKSCCGCPSISSMSMSHYVSCTPHFCSHLPQDSFLQTSGWEHARHGLSLYVFMMFRCFSVSKNLGDASKHIETEVARCSKQHRWTNAYNAYKRFYRAFNKRLNLRSACGTSFNLSELQSCSKMHKLHSGTLQATTGWLR